MKLRKFVLIVFIQQYIYLGTKDKKIFNWVLKKQGHKKRKQK